MDTGDWRLHPDSRQRIVNKVVETLKKHLPASGPEGLHELAKAAERFEEKIYTAATSQSDYLRKISLKMLTIEKKSQNTMASSLPTNSGGNNNFQPVQGGEPTMDTGDWRTGLHPDSRQRIVNKIVETLKKHLPASGPEGLHELEKTAETFEEKIYTAATSQSDYLRKTSLKMLTVETQSKTTI